MYSPKSLQRGLPLQNFKVMWSGASDMKHERRQRQTSCYYKAFVYINNANKQSSPLRYTTAIARMWYKDTRVFVMSLLLHLTSPSIPLISQNATDFQSVDGSCPSVSCGVS
jgi:hypothetical protein